MYYYDYTTIFSLILLFFFSSIVAFFTAHENIIDIVLVALFYRYSDMSEFRIENNKVVVCFYFFFNVTQYTIS